MKYANNKLSAILICLVLVLSTAAVYFQVHSHEFVSIDDQQYVSENEQVLAGLTWRGLVWAFTTNTMGNWHPLTWLSLMLECHFFENKARACHITNALFHIANSLLLFLVLVRMTGKVWPSGFVAVLFALHPLHVESVVWISERKDVLSTFFWLLTMGAYTYYARRPSLSKYMLVVIFFVLGLMAKPMLVTLPFVLLLLDYWPLERLRLGQSRSGDGETDERVKLEDVWKTSIRLLVEKVPLFVLVAISCIVTFLAQQSVGAIGNLRLIVRTANVALSYNRYIWMMFWPSKLAVFYPYPQHLPEVQIIVSAIFLLFVSIVSILLIRRCPYFIVGWLWYLGTLVPVIGLIKIGAQALADRYTYIPLTGLFIIIAWGGLELTKAMRHRRFVLAFAAIAIISALAVRTWFQVGFWQNSVSLYEHALAVTKDNYLMHKSLASEILIQGKSNEAIEHYLIALQINPNYHDAISDLGIVLTQKNRINEAINHYRNFLKRNLDDYLIRKRLADALRHRATTMAQSTPWARSQISDDLNEAAENYKQALQFKQDDFEVHYYLAVVLEKQDNFKEAIKHYKESLRINSNQDKVRRAMERVLIKQDNLQTKTTGD